MTYRSRQFVGALLLLVAALLGIRNPLAHEARPLHVRIETLAAGAYQVTIRAPESIAIDNLPWVQWPDTCASPAGDAANSALQHYLLRCSGDLAGAEIAIRYPLFNPVITTLITWAERPNADLHVVLRPTESTWRVPKTPGSQHVPTAYLRLGMEHILTGADHLLFIGALLAIAGAGRRIVLAVTGFTLAHSLTLTLAALEFVAIPIPPTEVAIALSIAFLARELVLPNDRSLTRRRPFLVATCFGLLHGLGFAAALREVGLPQRDILIALVSFNLGVEAGQILFIAMALIALWLVEKTIVNFQRGKLIARSPMTIPALGYGIGATAAFWCMQRILVWQVGF
ncbi:MAG: HupE/UreJ family protein [Gammaproteobacteria bacterium]|nr:MAG: HupE/UreJ family protein [Gammaproteobacteria bacterium]